MKNPFAILFLITTLVLGAVCLYQRRGPQPRMKEKESLAKLEQALEETERKAAAQQVVLTNITRERDSLKHLLSGVQESFQTMKAASEQAARVKAPVAGSAAGAAQPGEAGKGGMADLLGQMMSDPEMKRVVRQQQQLGVNMLYGGLFKELGLAPEDAQKLKDLLLDKQMATMERTSSIMKASGDERKQLMQEIANETRQNDEAIKTLLGDDHYAQYKDYTEMLSERMMLNQFTSQQPLDDAQTKQLLQIMKEEKRNVSASLSGVSADPQIQGLGALQSDAEGTKFVQQQEEVNRRILARAEGLLSPEQASSLASFQSNQVAMQRMGLTMARKMMGTPNPAPPKP